MTTSIKTELIGQSKGVVAACKIESDELSSEELIAKTKEVFNELDKYATACTFQKSR